MQFSHLLSLGFIFEIIDASVILNFLLLLFYLFLLTLASIIPKSLYPLCIQFIKNEDLYLYQSYLILSLKFFESCRVSDIFYIVTITFLDKFQGRLYHGYIWFPGKLSVLSRLITLLDNFWCSIRWQLYFVWRLNGMFTSFWVWYK